MLALYNLSPQRLAAPASRAAWPQATLPALLAAQVARDPNRVALDDGTQALTYGALFEQARAVAAGLRARGVRPGDVVAYQLPTAIDTVVLHYAIAYAGAVASPISLLHREHDLRHMLGLVAPRLVFGRPEYRGQPYAAMLADAARAAGVDTCTLPLPADGLAALCAEPNDLPEVGDPNAPLYIV